ncbi:MAG: hypothetical protein WC323_02525 [Patescibacteria group bacterium]|jgi:hypothetical protein
MAEAENLASENSISGNQALEMQDQISASRQMQSEQQADRREERAGGEVDRVSNLRSRQTQQNKKEIDEVPGASISSETRFDAAYYGQSVGEYLKQEIADGKFTAFLLVLLLSAIKDFVDLTSGGTITVYIIGPFISSALFIIFFMRKSCFKRWFIRKYLWKYVAWAVVGYIPFLAAMPEMVVATILLKLKTDKRIRKLEEEMKEVERETKRIEKRHNKQKRKS